LTTSDQTLDVAVKVVSNDKNFQFTIKQLLVQTLRLFVLLSPHSRVVLRSLNTLM